MFLFSSARDHKISFWIDFRAENASQLCRNLSDIPPQRPHSEPKQPSDSNLTSRTLPNPLSRGQLRHYQRQNWDKFHEEAFQHRTRKRIYDKITLQTTLPRNPSRFSRPSKEIFYSSCKPSLAEITRHSTSSESLIPMGKPLILKENQISMMTKTR